MSRQGWAWLLPTFGMGLAQAVQAPADVGRVPFVVAGLLAGAGWQLLYRRDLAERLTFPAVAVSIAVGVTLVSGEEIALGDRTVSAESVLLYAGGVLVALVLTERWLRRAAPEPSPAPAPR
ncbi:hypothetical protein ACFQ3F_00405 [Nocardioides ginsengisoli]|uniref:Uncharacterized protein n=1 Tax=Nocardioides ginsengisoli TaxID=363868 RepID=A0ABW3VU51_9ACTN